MSEHRSLIRWTRGTHPFAGGRYSRAHQWEFDGGLCVQASASPHIVPAPWSEAAAVDPEEAFAASLASCHMLWFLSLAARNGFCVESYEDHASAILGTDDAGRQAIVRVILRPCVHFQAPAPGEETIDALHHEAHEKCFLANSVKSEIVLQPVHAASVEETS